MVTSIIYILDRVGSKYHYIWISYIGYEGMLRPNGIDIETASIPSSATTINVDEIKPEVKQVLIETIFNREIQITSQ